MRKFLAVMAAIFAALAIAGCGGGGRPAPPTDVVATPHDSSAVITWTQSSGVEYWVWIAPGATITPESCATQLACTVRRGVSSPFLLLGLSNGTTYAVTITGRTDGDPVGPASIPVAFVPNLAGSSWTVGTPVAVTALSSVVNAESSGIAASAFVAVGTGGSLYSSSDALHWTAQTSRTTNNLNAALYADGRYIAAGDGGVITASSDGVAYGLVDSRTTNNLYALTATTGSTVVAVGAGGVITVSNDGLNWTLQTGLPSTNNLYGVTFANNLYVAVGANGTLLTSGDSAAWRVVSVPTSADLRAVAFGANTFVAAGANGTLLTSPDGVAWTARSPFGSANIASIVYGSQFVAVGSGGSVFTSIDGINWTPAVSGTSNDLTSVTFSSGVVTSSLTVSVGYVAVGVGGVNLTSF